MTRDKIYDFQEYYSTLSKNTHKNKKLIESIEIGNKIISGETTYECKNFFISNCNNYRRKEKVGASKIKIH